MSVVSSANKTDRPNIIEILLKEVLNTTLAVKIASLALNDNHSLTPIKYMYL
jgi:hypothetical protein